MRAAFRYSRYSEAEAGGRGRTQLISTAAILSAFRGFSNEYSGRGYPGASCAVVTGNPSEQEIIRSIR
jgi:hypothetical protein